MIKNNTYPIILIIVCFICVIGIITNIFISLSTPLTATQIFNKSKLSIVELKASSESVGTSYGTAEIIDSNGTLITNAHIITYKQLGVYHEFDNVYIRFINENDFREVSIVKYDLEKDIAVLKFNCDRKLEAISIEVDKKINTGEKVYTIGNMSNYGLSISTGIIAIPYINVEYNEITRKVIQCDLTISDGNSGGALLNEKGQLIGITSFHLKDLSNNIIYGISYCVPMDIVMEYISLN